MKKTGKKIIVLNEVESTNNYASRLILSNAAEEGTIVLTHFQKRGKGQAGNRWESAAGKNLLASIILFPRFLNAGNQFLLSKVASLGLVEFLRGKTEQVSIKWPNDIYVGDKKIAGILIENTVKGNNLFSSVLGIGLNLNQLEFLSDAPNPVSLKQITGASFEIERVALEISELISKWYGKLTLGKFPEIDTAYLAGLYRCSEWAAYSKNGEHFEARIVGIGEFGQLRLEKRSGVIEEFLFKEVEFIL